jgi:hypothetical protein
MPFRLSDEQKLTYAGIWLLKKLDLMPTEGGLVLPLLLPAELTPLDDVLHALQYAGHVEPNHKKQRWDITKAGFAYIGALIDEAEALVDEFDDDELEDVIAELRRRNLDVFRARFLWGWYTGELDDLVLYQQRRGITPVEPLWAYYLAGDELWADLAREIGEDGGRALRGA